jgi:hypothetical protein
MKNNHSLAQQIQNMIFRIILGIYLIFHFVQIIPYTEELFGQNMPYDYKLSPLYGIVPNILEYINATYFVIFLTFLSMMLTAEIYPRICAFLLWFGWASLFNRNILISNPGIPYVGWSLLALSLVDSDPQRTLFQTQSPFLRYIQRDKFPKRLFWAAYFLIGAGYTISGLDKLVRSPSWVDGSALQHVLEGCLARDNFLRNLLIQFPIFLKLSTWFSLFLGFFIILAFGIGYSIWVFMLEF